MKKFLTLVTVLSICLNFSFAQTQPDTITIKKGFSGYKFYQGDKKLTMSELVNTMKPNDLAYKAIKTAQTANTLSQIIGGVGGALVGWPVGTALGGGKANWTLAGIGAGLIVASIPLSIKFSRHAKQAVAIFNGKSTTSSFWDKNELKIALTANGAGLTLRF